MCNFFKCKLHNYDILRQKKLNEISQSTDYVFKILFLFPHLIFCMKRLFILVLFVFLMLFTKAQVNVNHYMTVGQTRTQIGNYTGAIEYFNIVIKFRPYLPEAYFYRGIAKHQLEDYRGAILDYNKAIEIKPFYPRAYANRGMAYHNLHNFENAIKDYNRALEFDPNDETIYNNRGIAKLAQRNLEGAIEDYNKALEINPRSTHALMNRSNAKIMQNDIRGAIRDLNEVIIIRPHYADAYLNRGLARFELEDYASALRDYDQCISLDPGNALAFNNRGIVKHKLEDYVGAIMDYDMAIQLNPEIASSYFNRAMAREILGRPGFERDYEIAALLDPKFDLNSFIIDAEQLAQNQQNQNQNTQQQGNQSGNQNNSAQNNDDTSSSQNDSGNSGEDNQPYRRRRTNVVVEDTRNLPEDEEITDGRIQNQNVIIDLQHIFTISAFERNSVDYDRFQYYSFDIDEMNRKNNYNPLLTISNRPLNEYIPVFENFVLYFNERINIQDNGHNRLNRGIFYSLTGKYNEALADLNRAIDLDNNDAIAYFSRANCRFNMIQEMESLTGNVSEFSISVTQRFSEATNTKQQEMLDYQQIMNDYATALNLNPRFVFGYYNRAYIKLRLQDYKAAIEDLNRAIEMEPEFAEAYFNRGLTKIYLDDVEGGALDLSRAGELGIAGAYNIIKRYCN